MKFSRNFPINNSLQNNILKVLKIRIQQVILISFLEHLCSKKIKREPVGKHHENLMGFMASYLAKRFLLFVANEKKIQ